MKGSWNERQSTHLDTKGKNRCYTKGKSKGFSLLTDQWAYHKGMKIMSHTDRSGQHHKDVALFRCLRCEKGRSGGGSGIRGGNASYTLGRLCAWQMAGKD